MLNRFVKKMFEESFKFTTRNLKFYISAFKDIKFDTTHLHFYIRISIAQKFLQGISEFLVDKS